MFDYDSIDIEEFKIEPIDNNINVDESDLNNAVNIQKTSKKKASSTNQNSSNDCGEGKVVETIKEEINEEESIDDPLSIHQEKESKEEDMFDYNTINIEEFKIEHVDNNINEDESDRNNKVNNPILVNNIDEEVVDNIEENVNEVEGNEVGQENNDFQGLENLSVAEALAFFCS